MLVTIHLRSAIQQCLIVALTTLSTIEIHMVPYKYTRKAFLQFPCTLAGKSPKWNILVVTWALVICLKYMHSHSGCTLMLVRIFQTNHSCPCYNYYICFSCMLSMHMQYCITITKTDRIYVYFLASGNSWKDNLSKPSSFPYIYIVQ